MGYVQATQSPEAHLKTEKARRKYGVRSTNIDSKRMDFRLMVCSESAFQLQSPIPSKHASPPGLLQVAQAQRPASDGCSRQRNQWNNIGVITESRWDFRVSLLPKGMYCLLTKILHNPDGQFSGDLFPGVTLWRGQIQARREATPRGLSSSTPQDVSAAGMRDRPPQRTLNATLQRASDLCTCRRQGPASNPVTLCFLGVWDQVNASTCGTHNGARSGTSH
jgi:hypothetical protein